LVVLLGLIVLLIYVTLLPPSLADASVIPVIPNGNVHSTVAALAFRAADLIAQDAGVRIQI
jgi:hypothetical protein